MPEVIAEVFLNHWCVSCCLALSLLSLVAGAAQGGEAAGAGPARVRAQETLVRVPLPPPATGDLEITVFRPSGPGPFPLLVMNHGKAAGAPARQLRARYPVLSQVFVERGWAVALPMRQGFAGSGGRYGDAGCDLEENGRRGAQDVATAIDHLGRQGFIDARRIVVMGQSHGGLVTLAYGQRAHPGVRLLVNVAGGLRADAGRCASRWREAMVNAFGAYGREARLPSLWFYGENDQRFDPDLARALLRSYNAQAPRMAQARLVAFGRFGSDAHGMIEYSGALPLWLPEMSRQMQRLGLPFATGRAASDGSLAQEARLPTPARSMSPDSRAD